MSSVCCTQLLQLSVEAPGLEFHSIFKVHICPLCWYIYEGIMCDTCTKIKIISFKRKLFVIRLTQLHFCVRYSYMCRLLKAIIGPSVQYFRIRQKAIQLYSVCRIQEVYNNCYNAELFKIVNILYNSHKFTIFVTIQNCLKL